MSANPTFWEVFVRPAKSATWQLVTPPGVADNGGLVAATGAGSGLTVAVRPSQDLEFTPVSATADAGASWSTDGPISHGVAASPARWPSPAASWPPCSATARSRPAPTPGTAGGRWPRRARSRPPQPARSAGRCTLPRCRSGRSPARCSRRATAGRPAPPACSPTRPAVAGSGSACRSPASSLRLGAGTALVRAKAGLTALWADDALHWYASAPPSSSTTPTPTSSPGSPAALDGVRGAAGHQPGDRVGRSGRGNAHVGGRDVGTAARRAGGHHRRARAAVAAASPDARPHVGARLGARAPPSTRWPSPGPR